MNMNHLHLGGIISGSEFDIIEISASFLLSYLNPCLHGKMAGFIGIYGLPNPRGPSLIEYFSFYIFVGLMVA